MVKSGYNLNQINEFFKKKSFKVPIITIIVVALLLIAGLGFKVLFVKSGVKTFETTKLQPIEYVDAIPATESDLITIPNGGNELTFKNDKDNLLLTYVFNPNEEEIKPAINLECVGINPTYQNAPTSIPSKQSKKVPIMIGLTNEVPGIYACEISFHENIQEYLEITVQ